MDIQIHLQLQLQVVSVSISSSPCILGDILGCLQLELLVKQSIDILF